MKTYDGHALTPVSSIGHCHARGERLLMLATLEDGIRTIMRGRHGRAARRLLERDLEWLTSDDRDNPFGFLNLCDFLGIDPEYLRARVLAARAPSVVPLRRAV